MLSTVIMFFKENFKIDKNDSFNKKSADNNKISMKNYPACKELNRPQK